MPTLEELANAVDRILGDRHIDMQWSSVAEARAHIKTLSQVQRELKFVKKAVSHEMKAIRGSFQGAKARVGLSLGTAIFAGLFGRRNAGKLNTLQRDSIRDRQNRAVAPYQELASVIDSAVLQLDQFKLQIEQWITSER